MFLARVATLSLAAYAVVAGGASFALLCLWRGRVVARSASSRQASDLLRFRMTPAIMAASAALLTFGALVRYEPRGGTEIVGHVPQLLAWLAAGLFAVSGLRVMVSWLRTARVLAPVMRTARLISLPDVTIPTYAVDAGFPVVAVIGIVRPKLVIAKCVLAQCSDEELRVVLRHEHAHVTHGDNMRQLLLQAMPDFLVGSHIGDDVAAAWHEAAEEAADEAAVGGDEAARMHLAAALVRVARLMSDVSLADLPANALFRGERLDRRVRRLLNAPRGDVLNSL